MSDGDTCNPFSDPVISVEMLCACTRFEVKHVYNYFAVMSELLLL